MSQRNKFKALDQRTGRLERAINLVNDGQEPNLRTTRGEADKYHPQTRPVRIGPERVQLRSNLRSRENDVGPFRVDVGYFSSAITSNFARFSIPCLIFANSSGTWTGTTIIGGYGEGGYGVYGYGGTNPDAAGGDY